MSIYIDKVHIYCDSDHCDNETMIDEELLGSIDFSHHYHQKSEYTSITSAVSDFALMRKWFVSPETNQVFCPSCDNGGV
jgi:hypothetical protein